MTAWLLVLNVFLVIQFGFVVWNLSCYPVLRKGIGEASDLSLSILIPARNEEERLPELLESLVQETCRPLEVLVLNDHSTDRTAEVVQSYTENYPWIRMIEGAPLPEGWMGKNFACHQLSQEAKGDWFLFLDADVRLQPGTLHSLAGEMADQKTGLLTGFPRQEVQTWMEKAIVPFMLFTIACHLPIWLVRGSRRPEFIAAHGGFLLVERHCYRDSGGHAHIRNQMVEDMALAQLIKSGGWPVTLAKIDDWVWMRMYTSSKEVFQGYQKNIFPGVGRRVSLVLGMMGLYMLLYVLPLILFLVGLLSGEVVIGFALAWLLGLLIKAWIDRKHHLPIWVSFFLPVSVLILCVIATASMYSGLTKRGYHWKGRRYI